MHTPKHRRLHQRKKRTRHTGARHVFAWFLWGIFVLGTIYVLFYTTVLQVEHVVVTGTERVSSEDLTNTVTRALEGTNIAHIAKNHLWIINDRAIEDLIKKEFPQIATVEIVHVFPQTIRIVVEEYEMIVLVCAHDEMPEHCMDIDQKTGIVRLRGVDLAQARYTQNNIVRVVLQEDMKNVGDSVIAPEVITRILYVAKNTPFVLDTTLNEPYRAQTIGYHDFYLATSDGWELRIDFTKDVTTALYRAHVLLAQEDMRKRRSEIAYVDVRDDTKVYYAFKEATKQHVTDDDTKESAEHNNTSNKTLSQQQTITE